MMNTVISPSSKENNELRISTNMPEIMISDQMLIREQPSAPNSGKFKENKELLSFQDKINTKIKLGNQ